MSREESVIKKRPHPFCSHYSGLGCGSESTHFCAEAFSRNPWGSIEIKGFSWHKGISSSSYKVNRSNSVLQRRWTLSFTL